MKESGQQLYHESWSKKGSRFLEWAIATYYPAKVREKEPLFRSSFGRASIFSSLDSKRNRLLRTFSKEKEKGRSRRERERDISARVPGLLSLASLPRRCVRENKSKTDWIKWMRSRCSIHKSWGHATTCVSFDSEYSRVISNNYARFDRITFLSSFSRYIRTCIYIEISM